MGHKKAKLVIHLRKRGIHDLRRHEVGKDFLHPDVVEPSHGDKVAEPHVRGFVRDRAGAVQHLVLGGGFIEQ